MGIIQSLQWNMTVRALAILWCIHYHSLKIHCPGDSAPKKDVERSLSDESGATYGITNENALNLLKNTNDFTELHSMQRIVKTSTAKVISFLW